MNIISYSLAKREFIWKLEGIRMTIPLSCSKGYTFPNLTLLGSLAFYKDKATLDAITSFLEAN